ncbi:MAG: Gfo/Idh/MocA family oxidoreductase [Christensenellaceae bacterium]|jgi:predicted dehydrogenase|nr:Gfo/Idh/MocA family oxidoreductase [Christensenellaceae bacterium]
MEKVRYGVIGIGAMGHKHALKISKGRDKNAQLTAVCDIAEDRRVWAKDKLGECSIFENYMDLINAPNVDAVIVATPHYYHPEIAIAALKANKHVLCEKPAGVYTKAVRELNSVAESKPELVFGIMYNQRTNPLYKYAKELISSGELGDIKRINWIITNWYRPQAYYDQGGWRGTWSGEGGGVLINQCPHQLDIFWWLAGLPTRIRGYCKAGVNRKINVENDVTIYTEYASGASGVFVTSTHDSPGTNRLEIDANCGKLVIEQNLLSEKLTFYRLKTRESVFNTINTKFMPRIHCSREVKRTNFIQNAYRLGIKGQHLNIIQNFSEAILKGETLIAPGVDGINGLTISNAAYLSTWLNEDIELPLDEDLFLSELEKRVDTENSSIDVKGEK